jgi:hypothetical protein
VVNIEKGGPPSGGGGDDIKRYKGAKQDTSRTMIVARVCLYMVWKVCTVGTCQVRFGQRCSRLEKAGNQASGFTKEDLPIPSAAGKELDC